MSSCSELKWIPAREWSHKGANKNYQNLCLYYVVILNLGAEHENDKFKPTALRLLSQSNDYTTVEGVKVPYVTLAKNLQYIKNKFNR
jgi:hypothetical protein